jgi:Phage integrase family
MDRYGLRLCLARRAAAVSGYFSSAFERHTLRLGLPQIRLHDARHTAATTALRAGVRTEIVSRWLGHHSSHFTADVYQHEVPSLMEEAGERVTALILRGECSAGTTQPAKCWSSSWRSRTRTCNFRIQSPAFCQLNYPPPVRPASHNFEGGGTELGSRFAPL